MRTPRAAASSPIHPPDEWPNTKAVPPAASTSTPRSSTSRSIEYGPFSSLSPRPRRSYSYTVKLELSPADSDLVEDRSENAPTTMTSAGPLPVRSNAIVVPSGDLTDSIAAPHITSECGEHSRGGRSRHRRRPFPSDGQHLLHRLACDP